METLTARVADLTLVSPSPERDAPFALKWFNSRFGKETFLLIKNSNNHQRSSSSLSEMEVIADFIKFEEENKQLTWMIRYKDITIGAVWLDLVTSSKLKAPAIHLMIGDVGYRNKGIGKEVITRMIEYVSKELDSYVLYSRHLANSFISEKLFASLGFVNDGGVYNDRNRITWQNVYLKINK